MFAYSQETFCILRVDFSFVCCRCLVAIVEILMPKDYYSKTLMASQADQRVLRDLLAEKLPRLSAHFESLKYDMHTSKRPYGKWVIRRLETSLRIVRGKSKYTLHRWNHNGADWNVESEKRRLWPEWQASMSELLVFLCRSALQFIHPPCILGRFWGPLQCLMRTTLRPNFEKEFSRVLVRQNSTC